MNKTFSKKTTDSLVFRISGLIAVCGIFIILAVGMYVYFSEKASRTDNTHKKTTDVSEQLRSELEAADADISGYTSFLLAHNNDITIEPDYKEYAVDKRAFEHAFARQYPGSVYGTDVMFDELPEDLKTLFVTYYHKFLLLHFEQLKESFDMTDIEYIIPIEDGKKLVKLISTQRNEKVVYNRTVLRLCEWVEASPDDMSAISDAKTNGTSVSDSENGKTSICYAPIVINGKNAGFVSVSSDIPDQSFLGPFLIISALGIIILLNGYVTMRYINRNYYSRLRHLSESIEEYTRIKDADIAGRIRSEFRGNDEIAILSQQTASMISELQKHIDRIMTISGELMTANERAEKFSELARKDAMTGLYNKMSYYEAVSRLDESIEKGCAKFAIIVIDLNYLKRINDEYGHNHGDIMIKKLADIIDSFFDPVTSYRIGGDEFAVILEGESSRNALTLTANFRNLIMSESALGYWIYPSAAAGCSVYRAGTDKCVRDVFDRADTEMYGNKIQMKASRKN